MVHILLIISWSLIFSSCVSIKEKSAPIETASSGVRAITDKTILYWKLGLDNVAMGLNKKNEIDKIKYEFDKNIKSNIRRINSSLIESCSEKDLLFLDNLLNESLELVRNNDPRKIGETFSMLTKDMRQSCKETWFSWFVTCQDVMKNLIKKYYTKMPSGSR